LRHRAASTSPDRAGLGAARRSARNKLTLGDPAIPGNAGFFTECSKVQSAPADVAVRALETEPMNTALSTALSGISAANERLRASASNIANLATSNQSRPSVEPTNVDKVPEREINPANEVVEQQSAAYAFVANLKVLQTQINTTGALLDIKA
jgi:hypothetical protein